MTFALTLAGLALLADAAPSPCPATATEAVSELGMSIHEHAFADAPPAPGIAAYRSFYRPALTRLGEPVTYAWVSRNHLGATMEVVYRLGFSAWTSGSGRPPLAGRLRDALPDVECGGRDCVAVVSGGRNVGDLESVSVMPVGAVRGGEGLAVVADDLATINADAGTYPVVLRCTYQRTPPGMPIPRSR